MPNTIIENKEKEVGYDYPLLANDPLVSELSEKLRELTATTIAVKTRLYDKIAEIRKSCPHNNTTFKFEKDPNYCIRYTHGSGEYGATAAVSKTCNDCGEVIKRPKGSDYEICYQCWGKMKYADTIPGQGSREKIYECEDCKSAVSHT